MKKVLFLLLAITFTQYCTAQKSPKELQVAKDAISEMGRIIYVNKFSDTPYPITKKSNINEIAKFFFNTNLNYYVNREEPFLLVIQDLNYVHNNIKTYFNGEINSFLETQKKKYIDNRGYGKYLPKEKFSEIIKNAKEKIRQSKGETRENNKDETRENDKDETRENDKDETRENDKGEMGKFLLILLIGGFLTFIFLLVLRFKPNIFSKKEDKQKSVKKVSTSNSTHSDMNKKNPETSKDEQEKQHSSTSINDDCTIITSIKKGDYNQKTTPPIASNIKTDWIITGESVIGKSHIQTGTPCQDNHFYEVLDNGWILAVVADGAGSAKYSHLGSKVVVKEGASKYFIKNLENEIWWKQNVFPTAQEWKLASKKGLKLIYDALAKQAMNKRGIMLQDLACTIIIALVKKDGILMTHIGDGRAGYQNSHDEWKPMLTPFRGEEANATVFITSEIWDEKKLDQYLECRVIKENIKAFTLMSDGCEAHAFNSSILNKETNQWTDPNQPFVKFFDSVTTTLVSMKNENISDEDMKKKWKEFLEKGTTGLEKEPDDKTMIVGVFNQILDKRNI